MMTGKSEKRGVTMLDSVITIGPYLAILWRRSDVKASIEAIAWMIIDENNDQSKTW